MNNTHKLKVGVLPLCVVCLLIFILVDTLVPFFGGLNILYSEGQRTGIVYKIARSKGLFFKTSEGELSLQLTTKQGDGRMVNQIFEFSVYDPKVVQELEDAAVSGSVVTLHYRQYIYRGYKYGSTKYDIDRVIASHAGSDPPTPRP